MPKSNLVTNYDKIFHDNLEFQFIKENVLKKSIAERVGVDRSTIGRHCKHPDRMTLLELTPQLGYAYLVPFDNKKQVKTEDGRTETKWVKEAQFQMGYKGYVQLALRSGRYKKLFATDVRKGEVVNFNPFEDTFELSPVEFEKRTAKDDKGNFIVPVIGYYAKFELMNGFVKELYMTHEDMLEYAKKYSNYYSAEINKEYMSFHTWLSLHQQQICL